MHGETAKYQIPLKYDKHIGYFIKGILAFIIISLQFFLKYKMFQANFVKNQEAHSRFIFFSEKSALFETIQKVRQKEKSHRLKYNTANGICMLHNKV